MFDYVRCLYPLPVAGAQDRQWQTKDVSSYPTMDNYEIREDGTLWHEEYDTEDHSDLTASGIMRCCGAMARVNKQWEQVPDFTGEIRFYGFQSGTDGWLEFSAYFVRGMLSQIHLVAHKEGAGR